MRQRFAARHRWIGIACLLTIAGTHLFPQEINGPRYDATPLQIPTSSPGPLRPATSKDILAIRDPYGVSISPDGKYVAFVVGQALLEGNSYRSGLFVVSTEPGSRPFAIGTAGMPQFDPINQWTNEAPKWSPDSKFIFRTCRMSAAETWQVCRWSITGDQPTKLTHGNGNVRDYDVSSSGTQLLLTVEKMRAPGQIQALYENGIIYDGSFPINRTRSVVSEALSVRSLPSETRLLDLATGVERSATDGEIREFGQWESDLDEKVLNKFSNSPNALQGHHIIDAKVSPDRHLVAYRFLPSDPSASKTLYQVFIKPVRGGTPTEVQFPADGYFPGQYWWGADSRRLFYVNVKADGRPATLLSVSAGGGPSAVVADLASFTTQWAGDQQGRYMVCSRQTATEPNLIALVDLTTGLTRDLVDLNPEFKNIQLGASMRIDGVNKFGDAWYAHVVKPLDYEAGKRYPAVLTTYRSGDYFLRGASGDENPIHVYAAHGFVVLSFDYGPDRAFARIHPGDFNDFVNAEASPVASIQMAIQKVIDMGIVDPARIGITGYSRGTEQAAFAITHTSLFAAASGVAGDSGPYAYYLAQNVVKKSFTNYGLGGWPEAEARQRWKQIAPELNADRISVPILNNDPDSEALSDLALYTSLKELGKPFELIIYPDELHHVNQPAHRYEMYERNVDWFRFWLKGEEDPDATKTEQYRRWRELRKLQPQGPAKLTSGLSNLPD